MKKIFVLILLIIPLLLNARTFTGVVKDEGGKPLPGVSVMLKGTAGRIRAYAITAKTGAFTLKYEGEDGQTDSLVFRSMGYATVTLAAKTYKDGRTITMREESFALKEVKVKPDKITQRGDTIDYLVSSFRQKKRPLDSRRHITYARNGGWKRRQHNISGQKHQQVLY